MAACKMKVGEKVIELFESKGIEVVRFGKNVARSNANIKCPYCGEDDPSHHMGISLATGAYACWRSSLHRGRNPINIVSTVLGCDRRAARALLGRLGSAAASDSELQQVIDSIENVETETGSPVEEHSIVDTLLATYKTVEDMGISERFYRYLYSRFGSSHHYTDSIIQRYDLRYAVVGNFWDRIIIPFYEDELCVSFTGRSLHSSARSKYLSLPASQGRLNPKHTVFNHNNANRKGGQVLVITEGPFDAMKIDFVGHKKGVHAIAVLNTSLTTEQTSLILELSLKFKRVCVVFDRGFYYDALIAAKSLTGRLVVEAVDCPVGVQDLGELTYVEALIFCNDLLFRSG